MPPGGQEKNYQPGLDLGSGVGCQGCLASGRISASLSRRDVVKDFFLSLKATFEFQTLNFSFCHLRSFSSLVSFVTLKSQTV